MSIESGKIFLYFVFFPKKLRAGQQTEKGIEGERDADGQDASDRNGGNGGEKAEQERLGQRAEQEGGDEREQGEQDGAHDARLLRTAFV